MRFSALARPFRSAIVFVCLFGFGSSPAIAERATPVVLSEVSVQPVFEELSVTGRVVALNFAALSVSIGGLVEAYFVDAGDSVERGQVLLQLDSELAKSQRQAALASMKESQLKLNDARRRLEEAQSLRSKNGISESLVLDRQAEVDALRAATQRLQSDYQYREAVLSRHQLTAPYNGVVISRAASPGEWKSPGETIFELIDADALRLEFDVPERWLSKLATGDVLNYCRGAIACESPRQAEVETLVPLVNAGTHTVKLRAASDASDLVAGQTVHGLLRSRGGEMNPVVPQDSLLRHSDGRITLWLAVSKDGGLRAQEHVVKIGNRFDDKVEILSPLEAGSRVVVQGNEALRENQLLQPGNAL